MTVFSCLNVVLILYDLYRSFIWKSNTVADSEGLFTMGSWRSWRLGSTCAVSRCSLVHCRTFEVGFKLCLYHRFCFPSPLGIYCFRSIAYIPLTVLAVPASILTVSIKLILLIPGKDIICSDEGDWNWLICLSFSLVVAICLGYLWALLLIPLVQLLGLEQLSFLDEL